MLCSQTTFIFHLSEVLIQKYPKHWMNFSWTFLRSSQAFLKCCLKNRRKTLEGYSKHWIFSYFWIKVYAPRFLDFLKLNLSYSIQSLVSLFPSFLVLEIRQDYWIWLNVRQIHWTWIDIRQNLWMIFSFK